VIRRDVLDEQDQEFRQDIDGDHIGRPAGMPGEHAFVDRRDQGGDVQKEKDEPAFEQTFQEAHLDAETVVGIAAEIVVGGLYPEEVRTEIIPLEATAENEIPGVHVAKDLVVQKGAGIFIVEVLDMDKRLEELEPALDIG
jgi:hypothetical protein